MFRTPPDYGWSLSTALEHFLDECCLVKAGAVCPQTELVEVFRGWVARKEFNPKQFVRPWLVRGLFERGFKRKERSFENLRWYGLEPLEESTRSPLALLAVSTLETLPAEEYFRAFLAATCVITTGAYRVEGSKGVAGAPYVNWVLFWAVWQRWVDRLHLPLAQARRIKSMVWQRELKSWLGAWNQAFSGISFVHGRGLRWVRGLTLKEEWRQPVQDLLTRRRLLAMIDPSPTRKRPPALPPRRDPSESTWLAHRALFAGTSVTQETRAMVEKQKEKEEEQRAAAHLRRRERERERQVAQHLQEIDPTTLREERSYYSPRGFYFKRWLRPEGLEEMEGDTAELLLGRRRKHRRMGDASRMLDELLKEAEE